jgi:hypothetical protein
MLVRLVLGSLRRRFRQLALIAGAVAVAAATVSTLGGFASRVQEQVGSDLAAFGANLMVRPEVGGLERLAAADLARVRGLPGVVWARGVAAPAGDGLLRLEVRAEGARLDAVAAAVEATLAGTEARPLLRVSASDRQLSRRLTLLLGAVGAVSLALALVAVGAATTALLGERRREMGLFFALGYEPRRVGGLFAAELLTAALLAALAGEVAGELAAAALAGRVVGSGGGLAVTASGLAAAAAAAVLVVGGALAVALRRVARLDAARVLQGE